jgi:hypothetical protein
VVKILGPPSKIDVLPLVLGFPFPSQCGASPAHPAVSACSEPCSRHRSCCWLQTALVAARRTDIHRTLRVAGVVLVTVVFVVGVTYLSRPCGAPGGDPRKFSAIPFGDIIVFGALVGAAVLQRQEPDAHKRLMLLVTISLLTAAVGRFLGQAGMGGPHLFYGTDVFVVVPPTISSRAGPCIRRPL